MAERNRTGDRRVSLRLVMLVILSILAVVGVLYGVVIGARIGRTSYQVIDDTLSVDVIHPDGRREHSDSSFFAPAHKGDTVIVTVPLPEESRRESSALVFNFYNSVIRVSFQDQVLYEYGRERAEGNWQIGHLVIAVPIPEEAWGDSLQITALPQENNSTSSIRDVYLMPAVDARLYPLLDNQFDFVVFQTLLISSMAVLAVFLLALALGFRHTTQGVFLALFLICVCSWYLGYQGLFYLFSNNIVLCANIEYQALYLLVIPFLAYIRRENVPRKLKIVFGVMEILFGVVFAAVTALYYLPLPFKYTDFLNPLRGMIFLSMVLTIVLLLRFHHEQQDLSEKVLRYGLVLTLAVGALEVLRITLNSVTTAALRSALVQTYVHLNFSRVMILAFICTLMASYVLRLLNMVRTDMERKQLEHLAFTDLLTGIPNRQDCERNAREIGERERKGSAVLFLDTNDLKMANDRYSHEVGDQLLQQIGESLQQAMKGHRGFYGRYGGDEFIACVYYSEEAEEVRRAFFRSIDEANRRQALPFSITVACGIATYLELLESVKDRTPSVEELIHLADARMYENKQAMKKTRAQAAGQAAAAEK